MAINAQAFRIHLEKVCVDSMFEIVGVSPNSQSILIGFGFVS